ncbi:MAG TPA: threonine synthase [Gaiellaceae bacterium]
MSAHALRCRVCEEVAAVEPADSCVRCDGPNDVLYDWDRVQSRISRESVARGPRSLWRYKELLPAGAPIEFGAGSTPLVRATRLSELLGIDLRLKLEGANPTHSFKDRLATIAVAAALDHGVTTLCCSSTGNLGDAVAAAAAAAGLEAIVLAPAGEASIGTIARASAARVFAVNGTYDDCRRLELELGALFPWGFLAGNLHPYATEGAKTISFEIAEQLNWQLPDAVVCATASGTLFSKLAQGFAETARAGLTEGPSPRLFAAQAEGASPIARAYADDRGISRITPHTHVHSLAVGDPSFGDLAIGAARASGGTIVAVPESQIAAHTDLLAQLTGVFADCAGGVALGALLEALRTGHIARGEQVVLVVSGAGLKPHGHVQRAEVRILDANIDAILEQLGVVE